MLALQVARMPQLLGAVCMSGFDAVRADLDQRFGGRPLIPIGEVADYLDVDRRTLIGDKKFPIRKVGNSYRVPLVALAKWLSMEGGT